MKIKLTCYYGDKNPGEVIDADAVEGKRLIDVGGGVAVADEPAVEAKAPAKTKSKE